VIVAWMTIKQKSLQNALRQNIKTPCTNPNKLDLIAELKRLTRKGKNMTLMFYNKENQQLCSETVVIFLFALKIMMQHSQQGIILKYAAFQ
jgi:hypothetical protein